MTQMEAHQAKSIQILGARRTEHKKKFTGAMPFVGPGSGGKNNWKIFCFLFFMFFISIFHVYSQSLEV